MQWDFRNKALRQTMACVEFGIEKETLRVTPAGLLSKTSHGKSGIF